MTLVHEDGTGLVDAESYCEISFIDSYHADRGNTEWASVASVEAKEILARKATEYMDDVYGSSVKSDPLTETQALRFPTLIDGLPLGIKRACAELALIAKTTNLSSNVKRGKKRVKIGPLEVEYDGNAATATKFVVAIRKIAPFLKSIANNSNMVKLQRS